MTFRWFPRFIKAYHNVEIAETFVEMLNQRVKYTAKKWEVSSDLKRWVPYTY